MKVLQFAFDSNEENDYLPHHFDNHCVVYTGTHDNETLVSWYQTVTDAERAMVRDYLYDYATPEEQLYKSMIALILRSAAATCIIPHAGLAGAGQLCPHQQALHRGPELALAAGKRPS